METTMTIPIWVKILTLILCALTVFVLAAWELVLEWMRGAIKLVLSKPLQAKGESIKEEMNLVEQNVAKPA